MTKISRENPIRICGGLLIRMLRSSANSLRLWRLRRQGLQCCHNAYVNKDCTMSNPSSIEIGANCCIDGAELYARDRITIGNRTIVGKGVFLCTGRHDLDAGDFRLVTKPITVGSFVWMATGATVLPGVAIGDGAVIGAMAVVTKDVPAGAVVVGNRARIARTGRACPVDFDPLQLASVDWRVSFERLVDSVRPGRRKLSQ